MMGVSFTDTPLSVCLTHSKGVLKGGDQSDSDRKTLEVGGGKT